MVAAVDAPLSVTIPAPAAGAKCPRAMNSAKGGEMRSDAAAPPTTATCPGTFSFADLLDVVNPLQHIPGVNLAYRALTGDTIQPTSNIAGGALYGGILGGLSALAFSMIDELSTVGNDAGPQMAESNPAQPDIFKHS